MKNAILKAKDDATRIIREMNSIQDSNSSNTIKDLNNLRNTLNNSIRELNNISNETRNVLDIQAIPYIKNNTDYKIIVDPIT